MASTVADDGLVADGRTVGFDELANRNPQVSTRTDRRVDPFWSELWQAGTQASWMSLPQRRRRARSGLTELNRQERGLSRDEALGQLLSGYMRNRRLAGLASLLMWRTLSADQLEAFAGWSRDNHYQHDDLMVLWCAELVERGVLAKDVQSDRLPRLWRPADGDAGELLASALPYAEWVGLTGGRRWQRGSQHDRHNLLAAELSLRAAEFVPDVSAVAGELVARTDLLVPDVERRAGQRPVADAVWLRDDGLRVAVELTNYARGSFEAKVRRWVELLSASEFADSGLMVVFVEAQPAAFDGRFGMFPTMLSMVGEALAKVPMAARRRVGDRMAVARWLWWFPEPGLVSDGFLSLECLRASGRRGDRWQRAWLAGGGRVGFDPADGAAFAAGAGQVNGLLGVPHWLRDPAAAPGFAASLRRRAAVD